MKISNETKAVLKTITQYQPIRPSSLIKALNVSNKTVHKHLLLLTKIGLIKKTGTNGKTFYSIAKQNNTPPIDSLNTTDLIVDQNYIYVSPSGDIVRGIKGFNEWCIKNNTNLDKQKKLYANRLKEVKKIKHNGLISARKNILSKSKEVYLSKVFFSDFYTLDHFGKTKLGQLVYLAKTSQNVELIKEITDIIKQPIIDIINNYKIQYVCFIPPTIDRKVQIMKEIETNLNLNLPKIKIEKVSSKTKVAQKTLRKLEDRIINAKTTIAVNPNQSITGNVLIIDDATGSGATLNETAKKIQNVSTKEIEIIGYTVVGSFKGFDVISEV